MAMHYTISTEKTACGRAATSANATSKSADVTCKTCCKSEALASAVPTAADVSAPASAKPAPAMQASAIDKAVQTALAASKLQTHPKQATMPASSRSGGSAAFKEWGNQLHSKDRLPRGKFFARHRHQSRIEQSSVAA